ncbi:hypothetical protein [Aeromicrobium sp.]|uniref:hypothetical protein n=1 Tax=Aeromicrobium sp. TaxID=1871063 RepID=UPI003C4D0FC9
MDHDEPGWPLVDDFFGAEAAGRSTPTERRYVRVRGRLTHYLDTAELGAGLGSQQATLLSAEREFHDRGAFWLLFGPDELVSVLPGFLLAPWLPAGLGESRTQISLVSRLLKHLVRHQLLDRSLTGGTYRDAEAAVGKARIDLAARSAAQGPGVGAREIPARFRRQPGPRW